MLEFSSRNFKERSDWYDVVRIKRFNDNTPHVSLDLSTLNKSDYARVFWTYEADKWTQDLFDLQCAMDCLKDAYPSLPVGLIMPYVPNARMDRVPTPGEAFTLKTFAKLINQMEFREVEVWDPHSDVTAALIDRCRAADPVCPLRELESRTKYGRPLWVFPDTGAMHRYKDDVNVNMAPAPKIIFGEKTRDWITQKITGYTLYGASRIRDAEVVIVDDIIAHGWTLKFLLEEVVKHDPKSIRVYATHVEDSFQDGPLFEMLKNKEIDATIYTTRSIKRTWAADFVEEINFY